jgi:hypothetical protein
MYDEDRVNHPSHYTAYPVEVIDIIRAVLGAEGFRAYCLGNEIKYRMRAGLKGGGNGAEDIAKAMKYMEFRQTDWDTETLEMAETINQARG